MAQTTIEWTWRRLSGLVIIGYTFNIGWGCTPVSEGCKNCVRHVGICEIAG